MADKDILNLLRTMKKMGMYKSHSRREIQSKTKLGKGFDDAYRYSAQRGYIHLDDKKASLSIDGREYILEAEKEKIMAFQSFAMLVVTVGMLLFAGLQALIASTTLVTTNNFNIAMFNATQSFNNAMERTLIPNDVNLDIWMKSDKALNARNLAEESSNLDDLIQKEICIRNIGRLPTGRINFDWSSNWTPPCTMGNSIENLNGGETQCVWLCVRYYNSTYDITMPPSDMINVTLDFKASCENCKIGYLQSFNMCIWHNNGSECPLYFW